MPNYTENSDQAFLEVVRILESAVEAGATSVEMEFDRGITGQGKVRDRSIVADVGKPNPDSTAGE
jgi:hypothetical protein